MTSDVKHNGSHSADISRVQQVILALERSLRSDRLYTPTHPVLLRHRQDLQTQFAQFFVERDELRLEIEPSKLQYESETVYRNENPQESLAFRLFNDGLRSVTFRAGVRDEELAQFLVAVNVPPQESPIDSDAVTLLWEQEFENISYTVADSIIEEPTVDAKSSEEKVEEIVDAQMSMYQGAGTQTNESLYQDLDVTLDFSSVGVMFQDRMVLSTEELWEIQQDITDCDRSERLVMDFVDMVLAVLQEEKNRQDFFSTLQSVGTILDNNLLHGRLNIARLIMEQVFQFPERPIAMTQTEPNILSSTLKALWPESRVDLFIQVLNQEPKGTSQDIEKLSSLISPSIIPYLLQQLTLIADLSRRRLVCRGIAKLHRGDLGVFVPLLASKDSEMVRTAIFILSFLKNEKIVDLLSRLVSHPDLVIRKEAIGVLRNFKTPKAFRTLLELLRAPQEEIRILALRVLAGSEDQEIARHLTTILNRSDFQEKSFQERKSYFYAISKIARDDFVPPLREMLSVKSWFRRPDLEEQYQCATYALSVIGSPAAKEVLLRAAQSRNKSVRRLSETALRLMAGPQRELQ